MFILYTIVHIYKYVVLIYHTYMYINLDLSLLFLHYLYVQYAHMLIKQSQATGIYYILFKYIFQTLIIKMVFCIHTKVR